MIQLTKLLISKGEFVNSEVTTIEESVKAIQNSREWLHSQKIDDILEYVEMIVPLAIPQPLVHCLDATCSVPVNVPRLYAEIVAEPSLIVEPCR